MSRSRRAFRRSRSAFSSAVSRTCGDVYKRQVEYRAVKEDVNLRIMDIMAGEGASFAFPSRSIYIENAPSLPDGKGGLQ